MNPVPYDSSYGAVKSAPFVRRFSANYRHSAVAQTLRRTAATASAWLLSGGEHHDDHSHGHGLAHEGHDHDESHRITTQEGVVILEIFEDGVPPRFRLYSETGPSLAAHSTVIETMRPEGTRQQFSMTERGAIWNQLRKSRSLIHS